MGTVKKTLLFFCLVLLPVLPDHTAASAPVAGVGTKSHVPRYRLSYRNAIRGLPCPDLVRLQVKMKERFQKSGSAGERRYYQGFLQETEKLMAIMLCPGPDR